jgi:hypothetical protein
MPSSRTFLGLAIALLLASGFGYAQTWAIFTFLFAFVAIVVAILVRPRERRARLVASLAGFGSDWGPEIGPAPGEVGPIIPTDQHPAKIMRAYPGQNEFEIRTRRAADQAALALRGYVPIGESFIEARWRTVDWLGALFFLAFLIIVIYMAGNRPGGTMTVTYERQSAGGTGVAGTLSTADDLVRRPAERLRSLDHLRDQGLISVDEWTSRRRLILAEI